MMQSGFFLGGEGKKTFKSQYEGFILAYCNNQHGYANISILPIQKIVLHSTLEVRYLEGIHFNVWFTYAEVLWIKL